MNIFETEIQSAGIQVLETTYILVSSKKLDIMKSRYDFLLQTIETLKQGQNDPRYINNVAKSVLHYKEIYSDREPQGYQNNILADPNGIDLAEFYCRVLTNAMQRFSGEQISEIKELSKESSKAKRVEKANETLTLAQIELELKCSSTPSFPQAKTEIEKMKNKLIQY